MRRIVARLNGLTGLRIELSVFLLIGANFLLFGVALTLSGLLLIWSSDRTFGLVSVSEGAFSCLAGYYYLLE